MSAPCPRGAMPTPVLEEETWDAPDRLTDHDWLTEAGPDRRWMRADAEMESDND